LGCGTTARLCARDGGGEGVARVPRQDPGVARIGIDDAGSSADQLGARF